MSFKSDVWKILPDLVRFTKNTQLTKKSRIYGQLFLQRKNIFIFMSGNDRLTWGYFVVLCFWFFFITQSFYVHFSKIWVCSWTLLCLKLRVGYRGQEKLVNMPSAFLIFFLICLYHLRILSMCLDLIYTGQDGFEKGSLGSYTCLGLDSVIVVLSTTLTRTNDTIKWYYSTLTSF